MRAIRRQLASCGPLPVALAAWCISGLPGAALAGETSVERSDGGVDLMQDSTDEGDARSSETSAVAEELVDAVAEHEHDVPLADAVTTADGRAEPLRILGTGVEPGSAARLSWSATQLFEGVPVSTPVLAVNGALPGPTLCLTAAVHGDELNGIEIVRRVLHDINPERLSGAVIGVPIVNVQGFRRGSRYLPDRRDLNRYFPGNPNGSAAARIAHSLFTQVIAHCDALVDLHTGSFERANLPQIRADLRNPDVVTLTLGFGAMVVLHSKPTAGTLRHAATLAGIPAVTVEAGGPSELELAEVKRGVEGIDTLLAALDMVKKRRRWSDPEPVYYRSSWVRADNGGILLADVGLGTTVRKGDLLGTITDPMNNARTEVRSPWSGRVIGMARNQVVMPGNAAFHIAIQADDFEVEDEAAADVAPQRERGGYVDGMSE
ncbi:MAG: succinylglutamate desuccinylase/aspartoacylase family protein [Gammaproteobacteria bacterium]|nr:succinylglutamate desuccinylase/aspartoacylase family protein [Gammaproteobacteria bacterium]NNF49393.1 succinylglutamate desuccinylase/aspartoacylase family protein [Woeseiaceae bacterium]MBT8093534.1 succinylglutamate desuccinylase/aspartoacylase family protein [Gammaproteobacteria bacterium]MBT8106502.1 succinylglutamate desuccinylase/aspartoacylase family protein [Gammaproteobacteria bacterium]NNK26517.1 succinylglutamate desuccinylase/aspartoacylase family protein [Woeseiaceae bacterium